MTIEGVESLGGCEHRSMIEIGSWIGLAAKTTEITIKKCFGIILE
jgi:UDP-N-acetylglucosamine enolpyruvyl transferase